MYPCVFIESTFCIKLLDDFDFFLFWDKDYPSATPQNNPLDSSQLIENYKQGVYSAVRNSALQTIQTYTEFYMHSENLLAQQ